MTSANCLASIADELEQARVHRRPVASLMRSHRDLELLDAWSIQEATGQARLRRSSRVGYKIGMTKAHARADLGLREPVFGQIFSDSLRSTGGRLVLGEYLTPKLEPECAFRIGTRLRGDAVSVAQVAEAVDSVVPAFEIVDSRVAGWARTAVDLVADNAAGAGAVLAMEHSRLLADLDFASMQCSAWVDGALIGAGRPLEQEDPLRLVSWLVRQLHARGLALEPGDIVLTGSWTAAIELGRGESTVAAEFSQLGRIEVAIV